jgi:hypothetical protein
MPVGMRVTVAPEEGGNDDAVWCSVIAKNSKIFCC